MTPAQIQAIADHVWDTLLGLGPEEAANGDDKEEFTQWLVGVSLRSKPVVGELVEPPPEVHGMQSGGLSTRVPLEDANDCMGL